MVEREPEIIKVLDNGQQFKDFDPVDSHEDSENVGEGYIAISRLKGLTYESAMKKFNERTPKVIRSSKYQTYVPCIRCMNCVIIRGMGNGEVKNKFYACQVNKMKVERYGTCAYAREGSGPLVLEENIYVSEARAMKERLVN